MTDLIATPTPTSADRITQYATDMAADLLSVAAWCDRHPEVTVSTPFVGSMQLLAYTSDPEKFAAWAVALADGGPIGAAQKSANGDYREMVRHFGSYRVVVYTDSGLCERVQVGVSSAVVHDPVALAAVPLIEVEAPIYEYRCPPLLGAS